MSQRVRRRLERLRIATTTEERQEIDRILRERTGRDCDEAEPFISDEEFRRIVEIAKRRVRERKKEPIRQV